MKNLLIILGLLLISGSLAQGFAVPSKKGPPKKKTMQKKRVARPRFNSQTKGAFFDDLSKALVGKRPNFGTGGNRPGTTGGGLPVEPDEEGAVFAWSKIISTETLENEVKSINLALAKTVTTPQRYAAGDYRIGERQFALLAVMFGIIAEYDGDIRWKKEAATARNQFGQTAAGSKVGSIQAYNQAKKSKQMLADMIRGASINVQGNAKAEWSEIARRTPLMKQLKLSHEEQLLRWTASAATFKQNNENILQQAELVAAIAEVLTREGVEDADDEEYVAFFKQLKQHAMATAEATKTDNAEQARRSIGEVSKSCSACHEIYRN